MHWGEKLKMKFKNKNIEAYNSIFRAGYHRETYQYIIESWFSCKHNCGKSFKIYYRQVMGQECLPMSSSMDNIMQYKYKTCLETYELDDTITSQHKYQTNPELS